MRLFPTYASRGKLIVSLCYFNADPCFAFRREVIIPYVRILCNLNASDRFIWRETEVVRAVGSRENRLARRIKAHEEETARFSYLIVQFSSLCMYITRIIETVLRGQRLITRSRKVCLALFSIFTYHEYSSCSPMKAFACGKMLIGKCSTSYTLLNLCWHKVDTIYHTSYIYIKSNYVHRVICVVTFSCSLSLSPPKKFDGL